MSSFQDRRKLRSRRQQRDARNRGDLEHAQELVHSNEVEAFARRLTTATRLLAERDRDFQKLEFSGVDHSPVRMHLHKLLDDATAVQIYIDTVQERTARIEDAVRKTGFAVGTLGHGLRNVVGQQKIAEADTLERDAAQQLFMLTFGAGTLDRYGRWVLDLNMLQKHAGSDFHHLGSYGLPIMDLAARHAEYFDGRRGLRRQRPSGLAGRHYFLHVVATYERTADLAAQHVRAINADRRAVRDEPNVADGFA